MLVYVNLRRFLGDNLQLLYARKLSNKTIPARKRRNVSKRQTTCVISAVLYAWYTRPLGCFMNCAWWRHSQQPFASRAPSESLRHRAWWSYLYDTTCYRCKRNPNSWWYVVALKNSARKSLSVFGKAFKHIPSHKCYKPNKNISTALKWA